MLRSFHADVFFTSLMHGDVIHNHSKQ